MMRRCQAALAASTLLPFDMDVMTAATQFLVSVLPEASAARDRPEYDYPTWTGALTKEEIALIDEKMGG